MQLEKIEQELKREQATVRGALENYDNLLCQLKVKHAKFKQGLQEVPQDSWV